MAATEHFWVADFSRPSGDYIGQKPLDIDFVPLVEAAYLAGLRDNALPALKHDGSAKVEPVWRGGAQPFVSRIRITIKGNYTYQVDALNNGSVQSAVKKASAQLVSEGRLAAGEAFRYELLALSRPAGASTAGANSASQDFALQTIEEPLKIVDDVSFDSLLKYSGRGGEEAWHKADIPVIVSEQVIEEAKSLGRSAGENESGGILLGNLCRDQGRLFILVRALIEAEYTERSATSMAFTAETWKAVELSMGLRNQEEQILGWVHSHPAFAWCRQCDEARRRVCPLQRPFFSEADVNVQRTVFSSAFMVAMLLSIFEQKISVDLFGWRDGDVASRGYYVVPGDRVNASQGVPLGRRGKVVRNPG